MFSMPSNTPPPSSKPPAKPLDIPYGAGDPLPRPEVVEHNPDTGWELWKKIQQQQEEGFVPTEHANIAAGEAKKTAEGGLLPGDILEDALMETRLRNRVCLMPARWKQLYEMLPDKVQQGGRWEPQLPPIVGPAWASTSAISKRLTFQKHIQWAHQKGVLVKVMAFYRTLPETDWLHMDET
jgi:hypothetical protein